MPDIKHVWIQQNYMTLNDPRPDLEDPIDPTNPKKGYRAMGLYNKFGCMHCPVTARIYGTEPPLKNPDGSLKEPWDVAETVYDWQDEPRVLPRYNGSRVRRDRRFEGEEHRWCSRSMVDYRKPKKKPLDPKSPTYRRIDA